MLDTPDATKEAATKRPTEAATEPPPPKRLKEVLITLVAPIKFGDEEIKELKFRRPTGGDIMAMSGGYPILINWETGGIVPNPPVMGEMMSRLAAQPPSLIKMLDAEDWSTCAHALMGFFPPGAQVMQY